MVDVFKILLLLLFLPVVLPLVLLYLLYSLSLYFLIWSLWLPKGKDVLFVSSDSPVWRDYMGTRVLPLVGDRAIVLNWSQRKQWSRWSLAPRVFRWVGGSAKFNPMVAVFRPFHLVKVFRFWPAFKARKHGQEEPLEEMVADLSRLLGSKPGR
jgi:hypothetical protein